MDTTTAAAGSGAGQPLSAQQFTALQKNFGEALKNRISDVELRKLALEQACSLMRGPSMSLTVEQAMDLVRQFHAFLAAPLRPEDPFQP
jgi:hypothetical protein